MTNKQKRFIEEYLKVLNGAKAARLAGYSVKCAHQQAYENLRKPHIREIIDQAMEERFKRYDREREEREKNIQCRS